MLRAPGGPAPAYWLAVALAAGLLACRPRIAAAQAGQFELAWTAPSVCPDEPHVRAEVERILHGPVAVRPGERLVVRAEVSPARDTARWHVDLDTDNGRRTARRSLDAASCDELANATALVVAIMIDPEAASRSGSDVATEAAVDARAPGPPATPSTPGPAPASSLSWMGGIAAGASGGYLASWTPGIGLYAGLAWRTIRAELGGMAWLPARKTVDDAGTQGADFQLVSGHAQLCVQVPARGWTLGPCAGADLAIVRGTGFGPGVAPDSRDAKFVSLSAGALVRWPVWGRVAFVVDLEALFPLGHRQFVLAGTEPTPVYEPSTVGARLTVGAEFRLE